MQGGIYARYSTDQQRETSIDDQIRRCRELAVKEGIVISDEMIFSDSAVSGSSVAKRSGYLRMLDAWDAGMLDIVFADEVSRFARDLSTGSMLIKKIEDTGVVVLTQDGIDSRREGWNMMWGFKLVQAGQEVRGTASRVKRGMQGQLERGHMIAQAAFGYKLERVYPDDSRKIGTNWVVDPVNAEHIVSMYSMRYAGMSVAAIARHLNDAGIASPRCTRDKKPSYWRPASVHRVLGNKIYRGVFEWNGSAFAKAKAKRSRRQLQSVEYQRPELRLVGDDVWYACNPLPGKRIARGGGKHVFAGLLECASCEAILSVGSGPKSFSLHCPCCEQAVRVGVKESFIGYTSVAAARQALMHALTLLFTGPVIGEFHNRLRAKLDGKPADEEAQLQSHVAELLRVKERILKMTRSLSIDPVMLERELVNVSEELKRAHGRLGQIENRRTKITALDIDAQCAVDPLPLLMEMLDGHPKPYQVRATLRRLVQRFAFVARPARNHAVFEIDFAPGVLVAEVSETPAVDEQQVRFRLEVRTGAARPVVWQVAGHRVS